MKYNDNGTYKDIYVKTFDTLPIGTEVDYDGQTVPSGWEEVDNVLYTTPDTIVGQTSISFNDISNYSYVEIIYGQTSGANARSLRIIPSISIGNDISFTVDTSASSAGIVYLNTARYSLTATSLTFIRVTQKEFGASETITTTTSTTPTNIAIYKIIGYK